MCKLRPKLCNGQNLPHESPNFTNYFFKVILRTILAMCPQVWQHITKTVFTKYFFVFYSKLQNVYEHVYLASQIVKWQNERRSNFYMVKWTLI